MKSIRFLFPALLVLSLVVGCRREPPPLPSLPAVRVHLAEVRAVTETRQLELPGTVRAYESAALAPKVMGSVQKLSVALGQSVRRGDVLVTLSANEIAAKLAQAEAGLAQAQRDVERETGLLAKGASAAETVRIAEDRRRLMQATVDEARTMLAYATITAPFDGVITRRYVNEGDLAAPGNPLLEMENPALERVEVEVPEGLAAVAAGTPIAVRVGSLELVGRLAEFSPSSDASSRTFLAKIDLPAGAAVRSGQFARVGWPAGEGTALMVPTGAVSAFGQMERVFVAQENRAVLRLVKTGAHRESGVEILSGLNAGERVIADAALPLRDGQPLEVAP